MVISTTRQLLKPEPDSREPGLRLVLKMDGVSPAKIFQGKRRDGEEFGPTSSG
jgi:hypothetical protein